MLWARPCDKALVAEERLQEALAHLRGGVEKAPRSAGGLADPPGTQPAVG